MDTVVTVRDIAQRCGLHFTTVALALRNSTKVAADTRAKVEKVAAEMGYRPNPLVSALMAQKRALRKPDSSSVLAHISFFPPTHKPDPRSFEVEYVNGARNRSYEMGYRLETFHLNPPTMTATRLAQILRTRAIPGLLLGSLDRSNGHLPRPLHGFASIALSNSIVRPGLHRMSHNHCQGSMLACRNLWRKGYRRIGLVLTTMMDRQMDRLWTAGYLAFHESLPAASRPAPLFLPGNLFPPKILQDWVEQEKPDVILTMHLQVKHWLDRTATQLSRKVDIATLDYSLEWEGCAGVYQKPRIQGREAISFLVSQIQSNQHGLPREPLTLMTEGDWRDAG